MPAFSLPSPIGGWNARDSLDAMDVTDAVELINWIPDAGSVRSRQGSASHATGLGASVETLESYRGSVSDVLICGANGSIQNVTSGTPASLGSGFSNNRWQTAPFNDKLLFVNGTDDAQEFDGTTLSAQTSLRGPETVTNGAMAADTDWTKGTGWTIAAGVASSDGTQSADSDLTQDLFAIQGAAYEVVYTVSNYSAGNVTAVVGDTEGTDRAANGTYTETIVCGSGTDIDIRADLDFVGDIDDVSVKLTGAAFISVNTFKGRAFYVPVNGKDFYYAAAGAYTGNVSRFALGNQIQLGGKLMFMANISFDAGDGVDDRAAFVYSTGEVLLYEGDDPGDAAAWSLVGRYKIGEPLSRRANTQVAGDVIILTKDGWLSLLAALQDGRYSETNVYSNKIIDASKNAAKTYAGNYGWECVLYPKGNLFVANVPVGASTFHQHVRNTTTGAWCKFEGLNAVTFAVHDDDLYFGKADGTVHKADTGDSDSGEFISMTALTAYQQFQSRANRKQITAVQVVSNYSAPSYIHIKAFADYNAQSLTALPTPVETSGTLWDVAEWDLSDWGGSPIGTTKSWKPVIGMGYSLALSIRLKTKVQNVTWYSTNILYNNAGVI